MVKKMIQLVYKKVLLIILDGFGIRENSRFNAVANAKTPNFDYYKNRYAFGMLEASGESVGLPHGQFGNSEVGHLNIGAGRIVQQSITRINDAIISGEFFKNPAFIDTLNITTSGNIHIIGLLSDGGVHSEIEHIFALIDLATKYSHIKNIWLHIILDGRDTPPKSADKYLSSLETYIEKIEKKVNVKIATISGRYYAMDRDKRYDRLEPVYQSIMYGINYGKNNSPIFENSAQALKAAYANGISDEFLIPCVISGSGYDGVKNSDGMIFANFRADRAIQLTDAIINSQFSHFVRANVNLAGFATMTQYDKTFNVKVAFPPIEVKNNLGEYLSELKIKQLRIAETEKYPHVTYFFNGGKKDPYPLEDRILIDSPRDVATYDLKPEMSLPEVANQLVKAIESDVYEFIITNFANGDMVGHSGDLNAAIKAVEAIDNALGLVIKSMLDHNGEVLIVADHGNCEEMYDEITSQPHTQHTTNLVPCLYIGRAATIKQNCSLKDIAPTLLKISGISKPQEMSGTPVIEFK